MAVAARAIDFGVQGRALGKGVLGVADVARFVDASHVPALSGRGPDKPVALELAVQA